MSVPGKGWRLYDVANGGLSLPPLGRARPAHIVRVDIARGALILIERGWTTASRLQLAAGLGKPLLV